MYTLIIVDDEPKSQRGLSELITSHDSEWEIAGLYNNGLSALQGVSSLSRLDLVITDIRMPKMDGLEFIEHLRKLYPHLAIIIISGYDVFAYARKALQFSVTAYLLKPIVREELFDTLDSIKATLSKQNTVDYWQERTYHESLFREVLRYERYSKQAVVFSSPNPLETFQRVVTPLDQSFAILLCKELHPKNTPFKELEQACLDISPPAFRGIFRTSTRLCSILLFAETTHDAVTISKSLAAKLSSDNALGLSLLHSHPKALSTAYYEAYTAVSQSLYQEQPDQVEVPLYSPTQESAFCYNPQQWTVFKNALSFGNTAQASASLKEFFEQIWQNRPSVSALEEWSHQVRALCLQMLKSNGFNPSNFNESFFSLDSLGDISSLHELQKMMSHAVKRVSNTINLLNERKQSHKIEEILRYVQQRYNTDISLDEISDQVALNKSYVSYLFKKKTNSTLIEYVIKLRIEKAQELLRDTNLKIYEIAHMVGYSDFKYFNRVFKKITSITPTEYRNYSKH